MTTDELAIEDIVKQVEAAWNRSDSQGFAAPFGADAAFIHIYGGQLDGQGNIEASHRHIFDTIYKGSQVAFQLRSIRFLRPDVALAFVVGNLKFQERGEPREIAARPTFIVVKEQGKWQIQAFQNTRISEMPAEGQAASRLAT